MVNISRSKDNQTMKFGQVVEHNKRKIKKKNEIGRAENEIGRPVPEFFLLLKKFLYEIKANDQHLSSNIFR